MSKSAQVLSGTLLIWLVISPVQGQQKLEYNRDIRPILMDTCFACHGPDSASRKGDLRLDQHDAAVGAGAIVPGKPAESEMIRRILSEDPEEVMPPPELKKVLSEQQKQMLMDWVESGAEYQPHWSFIAPVRPQVPEFSSEIRGAWGEWVKNPIDAFLLQRMLRDGLTPNPEADRWTLARRVSLDVTGLPPEPEEVDAFVEDNSPNAYEKFVDRMLAKEQWGEHRARYWLDYARYADTHGVHFDNYREMWSYRDWVIRAFNENMPFDEFTRQNLAGDLYPNATLDQKIASGFNRCNMTTNEGGIIDEEYAVLYTRDRTETVSQVWMALTAGCGVCHSHKFDPLSQKEFYELSAFFNNSTQPVRDGNVKDTPPIIVVPERADRARWEVLPQLLSEARSAVDQRRATARAEFEQWQATASPEVLGEPVSQDGRQVWAALTEGDGATVNVTINGQVEQLPLSGTAKWRDGQGGKALAVQGAAIEIPGVGDFDRDNSFSVSAWVNIPANDSTGSVCARMDNTKEYRGWDLWIQQRRLATHLVNSWPGNALKVVTKNQIPANEWAHVAMTWDGSGRPSGVKLYINGVLQETNTENDSLKEASLRTDVPFRIGSRHTTDEFSGGLQELSLYGRQLNESEVSALAKLSRYQSTLARPVAERTDADRDELYGYWLVRFDQQYPQLMQSVSELEREEADIKTRGTIAHIMNERKEPALAYVLFRGEYDQRREQVSPDTPEALPAFPASSPRNRLGFADWLLLPEHPLTARVTVNRYWQEVFGSGLVRTTGDFGVSGELPSHPELLDWLAVEFRETGWDIKRLVRMYVMSSAYRQSATTTPEKLEKDPANRLLSRAARFRMDAEMVRDYALAASGLLVRKIGGPSVKPYQPDGVWEAIAMNVSNTRSYSRDTGESLYRRSMYTFVKRMAPPASMDIFNAPNRELCVVRRERTNTPLQALVTLNDEQFVEAARHLAQRVLLHGGLTTDERLRALSRRLLSREFRPEEQRVVTGSLEQLLTWYRDHEDEAALLLKVGETPSDAGLDSKELAAWTMLCNELMNLDEVLTK
ncbi:MAG: DUF1553 domain-containing protein [Planctomyces sp.]|nr:DUF1553 domain-containing protein [Planctomyces sp.]